MNTKTPECPENCDHHSYTIDANVYVFTTESDREAAIEAILQISRILGDYDRQKDHSYDLHSYDFTDNTRGKITQHFGKQHKPSAKS
jgi:hypothetical protein